jgi:putative addiction module CopG family antidote
MGMPSKYTLNASLTHHLCAFVESQVASGRFGNASEVVRAGLRLLEQDVQAFQAPEVRDGADRRSSHPGSHLRNDGGHAVLHRGRT